MRTLGLIAVVLAVGCAPLAEREEAAPPPPPRIGARPPPRPTTRVTGERRWYALSRVWLGPTDRATGTRDTRAWKRFGFDLDNRITTKDDSKSSVNSCKRLSGSPTNVLTDGESGIDNNFGQQVMSIVLSMKADAEESANQEIASGSYTLLLRIDGATDDDNASAPGALYAAGPLGHPATFADNESWPVWDATVDGDIERPVRAFTRGYIVDGVWFSGEVDTSPLPIWIPILSGPVDIHARAMLALDLRDGRGMIGAAVPASEVVRTATTWAVKVGTCPGSATFDQVMSTLTQAVDLTAGAPTLQDTTRACDALSLGLGFDVVRSGAPTTIVAAPPPAPTGCPAE